MNFKITNEISAMVRDLNKEIRNLEAQNIRLKEEVEFLKLELKINGNGKIYPIEDVDLKKLVSCLKVFNDNLQDRVKELERIMTLKSDDKLCRQGKIVTDRFNDFGSVKKNVETSDVKKKKNSLEVSFSILKEFLISNPRSLRNNIIRNTKISDSMFSIIINKYKSFIVVEKNPSNRRQFIYSMK